MKDLQSKLLKIREPEEAPAHGVWFFNSVMIFVAGGVLGYISKWLDLLELDSTVGWHRIVEQWNLGVVFSEFPIWILLALAIAVLSASPARASLNVFFFLGAMCLSYHVYTILHAGFNPLSYMLGWYILAAGSTVLAAVCWYGRGVTIWSVILDVLILAVMTRFCFSVGHWYIGFNGAVNAGIYAVSVLLLHRNAKWTSVSVLGGILVAILLGPLIPV